MTALDSVPLRALVPGEHRFGVVAVLKVRLKRGDRDDDFMVSVMFDANLKPCRRRGGHQQRGGRESYGHEQD